MDKQEKKRNIKGELNLEKDITLVNNFLIWVF